MSFSKSDAWLFNGSWKVSFIGDLSLSLKIKYKLNLIRLNVGIGKETVRKGSKLTEILLQSGQTLIFLIFFINYKNLKKNLKPKLIIKI